MADYPAEFLTAVADVLKWEGGYVNDPKDPGGETNMGISKRSYPDLDIKALTRDEAVAIYFRDFWEKYHLDTKLDDPAIRAKCFNMGVLMGPLTALALAMQCNTLAAYKSLCADHFHKIVASHPTLMRYLQGWLRRAAA